MNDTFDLNTMLVRTLVFMFVAAVFYFVLKSKKN